MKWWLRLSGTEGFLTVSALTENGYPTARLAHEALMENKEHRYGVSFHCGWTDLRLPHRPHR